MIQLNDWRAGFYFAVFKLGKFRLSVTFCVGGKKEKALHCSCNRKTLYSQSINPKILNRVPFVRVILSNTSFPTDLLASD